MSDRESVSRNGSVEPPGTKPIKMSRAHSRTRSRSPPPKSHRKYRSPPKMAAAGAKKSARYSGSRSRSGSRTRGGGGGGGYRAARYSRSRSYSPRGSYRRSHSHSPGSSRRRHLGDREAPPRDDYDRRYAPVNIRAHLEKQRERQAMMENPEQSRCLGVFGLSLHTTEHQINHIFSKYGPVERVQVVMDAKTGRSRGFCFVYMESMDDAKVAKGECSGMEIDGRRIRVDFSITQRAHTPTPGIYMGKPTFSSRDTGYGYSDRRRDRDDYYGGGRGGGGGYRDRERERDSYRSSYRRSPSPAYRGRSSRRYERERSYSPRRY